MVQFNNRLLQSLFHQLIEFMDTLPIGLTTVLQMIPPPFTISDYPQCHALALSLVARMPVWHTGVIGGQLSSEREGHIIYLLHSADAILALPCALSLASHHS